MLESVVVATIMVSAVAYVATFETPPTTGAPARDVLKQRAQDALDGLYDIPVEGSSRGDNLLSVLLADCMQGNCQDMKSRLSRLLPEGTEYSIYISNGYATFSVLDNATPAGEAVTVSHLLEPKWSHSFVTTGATNVNPAADALVTYTLPVFNSNTLSQGGSPLRVIAHGTRTSDGANYTVTGFFSTQAVAESDKSIYPAVSSYFVDFKGVPLATWDATFYTVSSSGAPSKKDVDFTLRINESAGVPVPAGTEVTISLPRGWTAYADQAANAENWTIITNATDYNGTYAGSDIVARMIKDLPGGTVRDLVFKAKFHGDVLEWYPIQARLSKGALSEANLLVKASKGLAAQRIVSAGPSKGVSTAAAYAVPQVGMSVPRPMGATATTLWTLAVDVPDRADENVAFSRGMGAGSTNLQITNDGGDPAVARMKPSVIIHTIEIVEQDGAAIFKNIVPVSGKGEWRSVGNRLVWSGTHYSTDGPLGFTFKVTGSGTAGAGVAKNPFVPPAQFDAHKSRMLAQVAPGFFRGVFLPSGVDSPDEVTSVQTVNDTAPPAYPGYATSGYDTNGTNTKVGVVHAFSSDAIFKSTLLPGRSNYTLNPVTSFQDSIHGSYVNIDRRNVPLDGTVSLTADVQSLLFALSQAGISAGVNLHFYPPWSGDAREPIWSQKNLDAGILGSDVTAMMLLEMNDDGYPDIVVGTSNGRVLALHALTGARLQGGVFKAPLRDGAEEDTVTSITHLRPMRLDGKDYIAVGTDKEGRGVYLLDKSMTAAWSYDKPLQAAVSSLDAGIDVDGDSRSDVLVGLENGGIYVLRALSGESKLKPYLGPGSDRPGQTDLPDAFYTSLGAPTAMVGMGGIGPDPSRAGFAITFQSQPGVGATYIDETNLTKSQVGFVTSLPRAGFQGVNNEGNATWTFFGSPVTTAVPTDYDGDKATDIVGGSSAGYVFMMNGLTATQPLFSHLHYSAKTVIDAEAFDPFHAAMLTDDGQIRITTDGWGSVACAYCIDPVVGTPAILVPNARSIALNGSHSFWLAGKANVLLRSIPGYVVAEPNPDELQVTEETRTYAPQSPQVVPVSPINASKEGQPNYFETHTHNFNDITFRAGADNKRGWVIGGPCIEQFDCAESLVMRTGDGGHSWAILYSGGGTLAAYPDGIVNAELTRINFTTDKIGWIVGSKGTILRSTDGGMSWVGVQPFTEEPVLDISCAPEMPDFCIAVTAKSAFATTNALRTNRVLDWFPIDLGFSTESPYTKSLKSVGVVNRDVAYIGAENMVLKTLDGGASWSTLPMNYVESDGNRIVSFPDGRGYIFGGNASSGRVFFLHDYALTSTIQTNPLTLPTGMRAVKVALTADYTLVDGAIAEVEVSTNGGKNWQSLSFLQSSATGVVRKEGDLDTYATNYRWEASLGGSNANSDLIFRFVFKTRGDTTLITPQIRNPVLELVLKSTQDGQETTESIPMDLALRDEIMDPLASTAVWDVERGVLHQPLVQEYWTRNVSGEVKDVETGFNVLGDWRNEVWVATGSVLAANSPDHAIYAGSNLDKYIKDDNRIYLLDGEKGTILARTASFPGAVTALALSDGNGDKIPEYLYATMWDDARKNGSVIALDPKTLAIHWTVYLGEVFKPSVLLASKLEGGVPAPVVGTRAHEHGQYAIPGKVYSFDSTDGDPNWASIPDQLGRYVVTKKIPPHWLFGPYVVEVEVLWTNDVNEVVDGAPQTKQVLQTARFYDYFIVTPPDALSPPSPIYQVHLVTWLKDWR